MATVVSKTLDKKNRFARLAVRMDSFYLYDQTNKRWESGFTKTTLNSLVFSPALSGSEKAKITVSPPNFNAACHDKTEYEGTGLPSTLYHVSAYNYGVYDPSAKLGGDGVYDLVYVDIELPENCVSSTVATLDYSQSGSAYVSPYSSLASPNANGTISLDCSEGSESAAALVSVDKPTTPSTYIGYAAIQLTSMTTDLIASESPEMPPRFVLNNAGAPGLANVEFSIPGGHGNVRTLNHYFTYVFAINNQKVDANGIQVNLPKDSKTVLNLLNAAIVKDAGSKDRAIVSIPYLGKIATV